MPNKKRYIEVGRLRALLPIYYPTVETAIKQAPTADVVPRAEYEKVKAENAELKRRLEAAIEDMKSMALAMRESDELSEACCFACICENLPDDCILPYGECPGYETNNCFEWRDAQGEG